MNDYRYPQITAKDAAGKIEQLRSFLHQLVDKLNMTVAPTSQSAIAVNMANVPGSSAAAATFDEVKALIIKSADIADAFYEGYSKKLKGLYVAQSDFGVYTEQTAAELEMTAKDLRMAFENIQTIMSEADEFENATNQQLASITAQAAGINITIQQILTNGVDKVKTSMGYTFDDEGLKIRKEGRQMENLLDNTGMYVKRSGEVILQANDEGVVATDVTVNNYLIMGSHARFEDYSDGTDSNRTACYFI